MKQQLKQLQVNLFPKPSEILLEAHLKGVKKCSGDYRYRDSYCARGVIMKKIGEMKGFKKSNCLSHDCEHDLIAFYKFGKKYWDHCNIEEKGEIAKILIDLASYNDSESNPSFLEMSKFMEEKGL